MPRVINVSVNGEFIRKDNSVGGVQGEGNATNLHLVFDASWAGYGKRVIWRNAQGEDPVAVILTHSPEEMAEASYDELVFDTPIPTEPLKLPGWCTFTIEGYKDDDVKAVALTVSDSLKVIFNDSFYAPGEPTPSQADQIMAEIAKIEPQMEAFAKEAKSWAVGGTGSREGEDTDNAKYYAGQAKQSAQDAAGSAGAAEASAEAAKDSENAAGASAGAAASSAAAAASSAGAASQSASAASVSASAASESEKNAKASETAAGQFFQDAKASAASAETYAGEAKDSASEAAQKADEAGASKNAAALSAGAAKESETSAAASATSAKGSETNAASSETAARKHMEDAQAAQAAIEGMTVSVKTLSPGSNATVEKTQVGDVVNLEYGIPRGEQGQGFKILGYFDNVSDLEAGVPSPAIGDAYGVGTAAPYDIYIWDGTGWRNNGPIQGPAGAKGENGADGKAATVKVGTVTTGVPGSEASVNNSGTQSDAVLDFTIPRGADGAPGSDGEDGGYYTPAVDGSGQLTWTASKSGMPVVPGSNIRGPQGQAGTPGTPGQDGKSPYQIAVEEGYTGTEQEFNNALLSVGNINSVLDAINGEVF